MNILVINGPNLNMLGIRDKEIYGSRTYNDLVEMIEEYALVKNVSVKFTFKKYVKPLLVQGPYKKRTVVCSSVIYIIEVNAFTLQSCY